jgi:hypothetical protein
VTAEGKQFLAMRRSEWPGIPNRNQPQPIMIRLGFPLHAMAHPHPTTTWEAMQDGNTFYSKQQVYLMQWQGLLDLSDYIVSMAGHGGPIGEQSTTRIQNEIHEVMCSNNKGHFKVDSGQTYFERVGQE